MAACPHCTSTNVRRTSPGALFDDYLCKSCGQTFEKVCPSAKRMAVVAAITLLTGGLDLGVIGNALAAGLGDDTLA